MPVVNKGKEFDKELGRICKLFNDNKTYDGFVHLVEMNPEYSNRNKCKRCGKEIYYSNVTFKGPYQEYPTFKGGTTPYSTKIINDVVYNICTCESCMKEKFPEWETLNTSRVFNRPTVYAQYAFDIPSDEIEAKNKELCIRSIDNFKKKYGNEEGEKRWNAYVEKQRYTNTFEYKHKKYGMTKDEFDEYNKSRAVTLDNFINRYGEELALIKWDEYVKKESYSMTKDYFIKKYGEDDGSKMWKTLCDGRKYIGSYSKISQELFFELIKNDLFSEHDIYFAELNNEYEILTSNNKLYYLDFYDKTLNVCIEFNGLKFHPKPCLYNESDEFTNPISNKVYKVFDLWKKEKDRQAALMNEFGIYTIIVWEDDYKKDKKKCICDIVNQIIKHCNI